MLKGEINVTNMKSLQLFFSSQCRFIPKSIYWGKNKILFTFDMEDKFCTDFRRGGKYGGLLEAGGERKHKGRQIVKVLCFTYIKTLKVLCKQGTAPCYKAVQYLQGSSQ